MAVWIDNFPIPPSVNNYLMPVRGRLVKTPIHREYRDRCILWAAQNRLILEAIKNRIHNYHAKAEAKYGHSAFQVDCYVAFDHSRVFTLKNTLQEIDANNFLKPLLDGLVEVLGIDDRAFFAGNCEKITTMSKANECSLLRISPMKPRTLQEIREMMRRETTPGS